MAWFKKLSVGGASHQSLASLATVTGCAAEMRGHGDWQTGRRDAERSEGSLVLRAGILSFNMDSTHPLPFCVYVLLSQRDHDFYVGFTRGLHRRFEEHVNGRDTSTASRRPLFLIHCEYYEAESDAERRERYLKTAKGRRALRLMLRDTLSGLIKDGTSPNTFAASPRRQPRAAPST